jgi:hypothetical protein
MNPPDLGRGIPSIGVVFARFSTSAPYATVATRSVYAGWQPAEIYTDLPLEGTNAYSPSIENRIDLLIEEDQSESSPRAGRDFPTAADEDPPSPVLQPIHIDNNWETSALFPNETLGELVTLFCYLEDSEQIDPQRGLGMSVTILFADMLSRISSQEKVAIGQQISNQTGTFMAFANLELDDDEIEDVASLNQWETLEAPVQDLPPCTEFKVTAFRRGFAYSMEGFTRCAAAGILLFHIFTTVIYMFLVLWFSWSCYGLRSLIEILVLAMSSPPSTKLNNSLCWRIDGSETYKHVVKVREVSERRIAFVLGHDEDESAKMPVVGKVYGSLDTERVEKEGGKEKVIEEVREVWSSESSEITPC